MSNGKTKKPARPIRKMPRPLVSARKFINEFYQHPDHPRLPTVSGVYHAWDGRDWRVLQPAALRAQLHPWLEKHDRIRLQGGMPQAVPFDPVPGDVDKAMDALRAWTHSDAVAPSWLRRDAEQDLPHRQHVRDLAQRVEARPVRPLEVNPAANFLSVARALATSPLTVPRAGPT